MTDWLKNIGSAKKPITEWKEEYVGFRTTNKLRIAKGDRLFLFAPGGSRRIFALAKAAGNPEHDPEWNPKDKESCYWKLPVRYMEDLNLPVASGILIDDVISHRKVKLTRSIGQKSHIKRRPEESESVKSKLRDIAKQISVPKPDISAIPGYVRVADSDASPSLDVDI